MLSMLSIISLLISLAVVFLCFILGLVIISFVHPHKFRFTEIERFFSAFVVGILFFTWLSFLASLLFGNLSAGIVVSLSISLIFLLVYRKKLVQGIKLDIKKISKTSFVVIALILIFSFFIVFSSNLNLKEDGVHIGLNAYGDMALHLSIVNSFSLADNFPPSYPVYSGHKMGYPFLFDFFSAVLNKLGASLRASVLVPTIIVMFCLFSLFYCLALRFSNNENNKNNRRNKKRAAIFALIFLMFSGGLGFVYFLQDNGLSFDTLKSITTNELDYTHNTELGLFLLNFTNNLLPQRGILFGLALILIVFIGLISCIDNNLVENTKKQRHFLIFLGILTGLLPMFHAHVYVSLMIFSAVLFLLFRRDLALKRMIYFFVPAIILAFPQALWMKSQVTGGNFLSISLGWMLEKLSLFSFVKFWIMNLGIVLFLIIGGFIICNKKQKKIALAFLSLFIVANIIQFQPWNFDNHKLLSVWLIGSVLLASEFAEWLYNKKILKFSLVIIIPIAIFSGLLTITFLINNNPLLYTSDDIHVADWINKNTEKHAVFLTSDQHNHLVPMLAGRTVFEGYRGWLWTHGLNYSERDETKKAIYGAENKEEVCKLLRENSIDYVFIGQSERSTELFKVNETFFENNFEKVFEYRGARLFKVGC